MKKLLITSITLIILFARTHALGLDLYSSPMIIAVGEIYLLSNSPETSYYQPAMNFEGISLSHSNPHGFRELNIFQLATQFNFRNELFSVGTFILDNNYLSTKTFYLGYLKILNNISLGANIRYYNQAVYGYKTLDVITFNIGTIWHSRAISHGLNYSNISHSTRAGINIPTFFKYELKINPIEKTNFALSLEKEKNFEMRYAFAVSHNLTNIFLLNTGFITNPSQFSAGVTIKNNNTDISIGVRTHNQLGFTQAVGIQYRL